MRNWEPIEDGLYRRVDGTRKHPPVELGAPQGKKWIVSGKKFISAVASQSNGNLSSGKSAYKIRWQQ
jgi:hypothetical protein